MIDRSYGDPWATYIGIFFVLAPIALGVVAIALDLIKRGDNPKGGVAYEKKVRPDEEDARSSD